MAAVAYYCSNLSFTDFLLTFIRIYLFIYLFIYLLYYFFIAVLTPTVSLGCSTSPHP